MKKYYRLVQDGSVTILTIDLERKEDVQNPKTKENRMVHTKEDIKRLVANGFMQVDCDEPKKAKSLIEKQRDDKVKKISSTKPVKNNVVLKEKEIDLAKEEDELP